MSLTFDQIPDADDTPPGAGPTTALTGLGVTGNRRTVLRAAALGAVTIGALALSLVRGRNARAETGPLGLQGWDRTDCHDAYPSGYAEVGDTTGVYVNSYPACFGGSRRGRTFRGAGRPQDGGRARRALPGPHMPASLVRG